MSLHAHSEAQGYLLASVPGSTGWQARAWHGRAVTLLQRGKRGRRELVWGLGAADGRHKVQILLGIIGHVNLIDALVTHGRIFRLVPGGFAKWTISEALRAGSEWCWLCDKWSASLSNRLDDAGTQSRSRRLLHDHEDRSSRPVVGLRPRGGPKSSAHG